MVQGAHHKEQTSLGAKSEGYLFCQIDPRLVPWLIPFVKHISYMSGREQQEWNSEQLKPCSISRVNQHLRGKTYDRFNVCVCFLFGGLGRIVGDKNQA